jgi:hypothetical protein
MRKLASLSWSIPAALCACLSIGCASVKGHLEDGRAGAARGDFKAATLSFRAALSRAQGDIEGEHFVHLQAPLWEAFADACVALGGTLDRAEGQRAAETSFGQCLGYAAAKAYSPYFAARVALRVEQAWSLAAHDRRLAGPSVAHGILAGAFASAIGRKESEIVAEHRELVLASSTAMFDSMSAGANLSVGDRRTGKYDYEHRTVSDGKPRPQVTADTQWTMISTLSWVPSGQVGKYEALIARLSYLDRAIGVRVALDREPTFAGTPQGQSLLAKAQAVERARSLGVTASEDDVAAFAHELEELPRLLESMPVAP